MSTAARKARKRAGEKYSKPQKTPTRPYDQPRGLGLVTGAELITALMIRGRL